MATQAKTAAPKVTRLTKEQDDVRKYIRGRIEKKYGTLFRIRGSRRRTALPRQRFSRRCQAGA